MSKGDPAPAPSGPAATGIAATGPDGARRVASVKGTKGDQAREARVKAALKANIARRKAQAKLRGEDGAPEESTT